MTLCCALWSCRLKCDVIFWLYWSRRQFSEANIVDNALDSVICSIAGSVVNGLISRVISRVTKSAAGLGSNLINLSPCI